MFLDDLVKKLQYFTNIKNYEYAVADRKLWKKDIFWKNHTIAFLFAVEKHGWLLPAAWAKRWRMGFHDRARVKNSLSGFNKNVDEAKEHYRLLKKIGL